MGRLLERAALGRVLGAVALLTAAVAVNDAGRQAAGALVAAPIARVQVGTVARTASATVAPALSTASTAGTLLVATLAGQKNASFTGPSGWVQAVKTGQSNAETEIWYYANNPGGITSASFTDTGATSTSGQLSEWSGVATTSPLDKTGSTTATLATSVAPATSAAPFSTPRRLTVFSRVGFSRISTGRLNPSVSQQSMITSDYGRSA